MRFFINSTALSLLTLSSLACSHLSSNSAFPPIIDVTQIKTAKIDKDVERSSSALHSYLVGQLSYNEDDFTGALNSLTRASKLVTVPTPALHYQLAQLQLKRGDLQKAKAEALEALKGKPDDVDSQLLYAGILEALGKSNEAIPYYEKALQKNPDREDVYLLLVGALVERKEFTEATQVIQKLLKRNPSYAIGYTFLARISEAKGDVKLAKKYATQAYDLAPENSGIALDYVRILLKTNEFDRAKIICTKIIQYDPKNLDARRVLGHLLIGQSNLDEALTHLQILEKQEEDATDTRFKIGLIQLEKQNFSEAERELKLVLGKNPQHGQARYYLAVVLVSTERRNEALDELSKVPKEDSIFIRAKTFAAYIARQIGDLKTAEKSIRQAYEADASNRQIVTYLSTILFEQGKASDAADVLGRAVEENPRDERLLFDYAVMLDEAGRREQSMGALTKSIELNPTNADALNHLAYIYAEEGKDLAKAHQLIQKAVTLQPENGYYLDTLGWIQFKMGQIDKAKTTLEHANKIVQTDPVILNHLGDVYVQLNQRDEAVDTYRQVIENIRREKKENQKDNSALEKEVLIKLKNLQAE